MIYEAYKIQKLALEVKSFLREHKLEEAYINSFRDYVPGSRIPGIEAVLDNHCLRHNLTCFLMFRCSIISEQAKKQGDRLVDKIDSVGAVNKQGEKAELVWKLCEVMKETDIFYLLDAGYVKAGDNQTDPVRRIYRDIENREKRQDIIDYLETILEKGEGNRINIKDIISSLENFAERVPISAGKVR